MTRFAIALSYVGTEYCGWQKQPEVDGRPSVQSTLEAVLSQITREPALRVVGSGRTDSGVHALLQIVHVDLSRRAWDPDVLKRALNSQLPRSVRAIGVRAVAPNFHAQRSAIRKQYSYYFQQGPCALPALEPYSWWIQRRLDLAAMRDALSRLCGTHDFKPFRAAGAKPGPSVRTLFEAEVVCEPVWLPRVSELTEAEGFGLVRVRLVGSGFLKQMVRGIAGTLLEVGEGRRPASDLSRILATQDRALVGPTAPARALWLERVWYDDVDFAELFRLSQSDYGTSDQRRKTHQNPSQTQD